MAELFKLTSVDEAKKALIEHLLPFQCQEEEVELGKSLGRVLAQDVVSQINVPDFNRSTMDGYAVRAADTFGSTEAMPAMLDLKGEVLMGQEAKVPIEIGQAVKISTGGMLPEGADAVVMIEYTEHIDAQTILVYRPVAPGENVVRKGEDLARGDVLLKRRSIIRPQDMGAMSGIGLLGCKVYKKPLVAIISTGDEIVAPNETPGPGQIRDMNSYTLAGIVEQSGGTVIHYGIIRDEFDQLEAAVKKALQEADIVVVSGGSSVGTRDVTSAVIDGLGSPGVLVHGVSVKPGKPTILGIASGKPIFGLPGHPASAMVLADIFLTPLIRAYSGWGFTEPDKRKIKARMGRSIASTSGRTDYIRVCLKEQEGDFIAQPVLGKSGLINTMIKADGIVVIPMSKEGLEPGEAVEVELF